MGAGIAQLCAEAGFQVRLCADDEKAVAIAHQMLARKVGKGKITQEAANAAADAIRHVASLSALTGCDLVIETQLADRETTQDTLSKLERVLAPEAVIALNTSAHPVSVLARHVEYPQRIAGLHFFEPAPLMRVVEVIPGLRTAPELVPQLSGFVTGLGHQAVVVRDSPGFVVNHIGRALLTEGARIVAENIATPEVVDEVARKQLGLRMGPFELLDLIGLNISLPVMEQLHSDFRHEPRLRPPAFLAIRVAAGLHGRTTGSSFYTSSISGGEQSESAATSEKKSSPASNSWPSVWIDHSDSDLYQKVLEYLQPTGVKLDRSDVPDSGSLCLITPVGMDATSYIVAHGLNPQRTIAVDAASGLDSVAVLMAAPGLPADVKETALSMFELAGSAVWIADSPGFIGQRMLAALVNLACDVAQQNVAAPRELDRLVRTALGYPYGPLEWGDRFGACRILNVLRAQLKDGDPRDRPTPWLRRRAELGLSLFTPD
ncbi:3-hydroxyacyl-CoA dehydrogenase [Paraburkholderia sp. G-4-1-8]|uniref:3-hydroxyacyl-CoA dehydrogenase n=2 Tax=Paraburkholderia antibiotica TaxID=2728839 RepID=A0A7X9ZZK9_9BURK|nr:3-hydroxyacyl-CoA dehydrogenase [Paraburkholderia antibiotica]